MNIREHIEMPLIRQITSVMFCAHDTGEHTVCWSFVGNGWMLENPTVGIIQDHWDDLGLALQQMEAITGIEAKHFTITDNPYGRG